MPAEVVDTPVAVAGIDIALVEGGTPVAEADIGIALVEGGMPVAVADIDIALAAEPPAEVEVPVEAAKLHEAVVVIGVVLVHSEQKQQ